MNEKVYDSIAPAEHYRSSIDGRLEHFQMPDRVIYPTLAAIFAA